MCRALWLLVVGADEARCRAIRSAAGIEAQVVGMTADPDEARALAASTKADAVALDGSMSEAAALAGILRATVPATAIVWVGADAPADADHAIEDDASLAASLPGGITAALIARRKPR